jgi:hypothetical protein
MLARVDLGICVFAMATALPSAAGDKKQDKLAYEVHANGHFVKNNAKLATNPAYLVLEDKKAFDDVFGVAVTMGAKPKLVDAKLFEAKLVIAVITSGNALTMYEVEKVAQEKGKLIVQYKTSDKGPTSAKFSSPLIVSVPRGDYSEAVFIANGKEIARIAVKK